MSTLYFADEQCVQPTHTSTFYRRHNYEHTLLRKLCAWLRAWFGKLFRIEVKPHPPVRLQFPCLEPEILALYVMLRVMRTLRASHLDCESFHSGGVARRD
jgi:hypothetical protein